MLSAAMGALPSSAHVFVAGVLILGLVLLVVGNRLLRVGFVGVGMVVAGAVGYFAPPALQVGLHPLIPAIILMLAGGLAGWLAFRVTVAVSLAGLLAIVGVSIATMAINLSEVAESVRAGSGAAPLAIEDMLLPNIPVQEFGEEAFGQPEVLAEGMLEIRGTEAGKAAAKAASARVRLFVSELIDELRELWNKVPPETRMRLSAAGLVGALLGAIVGFLAPRKSGALTTSAVGAGLVLIAGLWFVFAMGEGTAGLRARLPIHPAFWATAWGLLAAGGLSVQWTAKRRKADTQ